MIFTSTFLFFLAADLQPGDHERLLTVDRLERSYLVHVPPSYDGKKPLPVVLVFHGGATDAHMTVRYCGLNDKADQEGFIVVYPNGIGTLKKVRTWNAGICCGEAMRKKVDDVNFVRALLDDLGKNANVDGKRVFATGISNGAMMTYRLAAELSDRIAAIAPIAGTMGTASCEPRRPVSVLHFHGTDDHSIPFKGGVGEGLTKTEFYSVEHSIRSWAKANGCQTEPIVKKLPDKARDGTSVVIKTFPSGKDGSEVVLVTIEGGDHTWPGRKSPRFLGKVTMNVSANDVMWEFFKKHPMK